MFLIKVLEMYLPYKLTQHTMVFWFKSVYKTHVNFLWDAVFFAIFFGCRDTCLPLRMAALFFRVVARYSSSDKDFIADSGKYLSPVLREGLPDLVRHFCLVHARRLL